ncbi:hypothetical protein GCM10022271_06850 [Corallibacter vietnamensis]|uniref:Uncharacterized protein n=1 Tax=Corallibacter vietnamensis TaxID=904130 RepID=A0ABP7H391_9FLAO
MKLSEQHIQDLYAFTRKHFVEHYDLQTELVDHLANDIESMWQEKPALEFETARDRAFKKFGVFGFMEAIEQKQKAMNKRYMSYLFKELIQWFKVPQILTTISLFCMYYLAFSSNHVSVFAVFFYLIISAWCIYKSVQLNRQFRRRKEISNKKWLLEEMIFKQAGGISFLFLSQFYNVFNITEEFVNNSYAVIGLTLIFTLLTLVNFISFKLIPDKAEELLNETYPEFSL